MKFNNIFISVGCSLMSMLGACDASDYQAFYKAEQYNNHSNMQKTLAEQVLMEDLVLSGNEAVLDIGCGDGKLTQALGEKITTGHVTAIDKSSDMIEFAKAHYSSNRIDYLRMGVEDLDTLDVKFDVITVFSAFHWFSNPQEALDKMSRHLKKGGRIYIVSYPKESQDWSYYREALLENEKWARFFEKEMFDSFFSSNDFSNSAKDLNLKLIKNSVDERFQVYSHIDEFKNCVKGWLEWFSPRLPLEEYEDYIEEVVQKGKNQFVYGKDGKIYVPYKSITVILEKSQNQLSKDPIQFLTNKVKGIHSRFLQTFEKNEVVQRFFKNNQIKKIHRSELNNYIYSCSQKMEDRSFHVVDLGKIQEQVNIWEQVFPRVRPYFSVKTNHDPIILETLAKAGIGFDCSTIEEIKSIKKFQNVNSTKDVIFAHPRKPVSSIKEATEQGIKMMVIDSIEELQKIVGIEPKLSDLEILIRIKTDDKASGTPLSSKFGATVHEAENIIKYAHEQGINSIKGVSFHVGSNNKDPIAYQQAIRDSARVFAFYYEQYGTPMTTLDIGGGWPASNTEEFINLGYKVNQFLEEYIPSNVKLVAEPGRFLCANSTVLVSKILGKKVEILPSGDKKISYFINNGVYGFFLSSIYYNHNLKKSLNEGWKFKTLKDSHLPLYLTKVWGPTLDSGDLVVDGIFLQELEEGDLLLTEGIGCYGKVYESDFSQQTPSAPFYIISVEDSYKESN